MDIFKDAKNDFDCLETDVVIIGSGGAGLRAAIEVRQNGRNALVISKGPVGRGACTTMSGGVFAVAVGGFSQEEHRRATLFSGRDLNVGALVETLTHEGPDRIAELINWGLASEMATGNVFASGKPPAWGAVITAVLLQRARSLDVRMLGDCIALEVLTSGGSVEGLIAYSWKRNRFIHIGCPAVILATGGAAALYQYHDNPQRMMGDGCALAFRAGARLLDMEFVQFYPVGLMDKGKAPFILPPILADWGGLVNGKGEDILKKYAIDQRPAAVKMRDRLSRAIYSELYEEQTEGVFCDVSTIPDQQWERDHLAASSKEFLFARYGADRKPLRVHPMAHHTMGGVMIDSNGKTCVSGLFAAGEVAGGVHGANRMGGNALTDIIVFGARAGKAAAELTNRITAPKLSIEHTQKTLDFFLPERLTDKGKSLKTLRARLRKLMWEKVGIVRNANDLKEVGEELRGFQQELLTVREPGSPRGLMELVELRNALLVARMINGAALMRSESRGAHYRKDFPEQDEVAWNRHILLERNQEGDMRIFPAD